MIVFGGQY
jgi:hypothetical protein